MQCRARKSASDRYDVWGMWSCCLLCLPGKSRCRPGVLMERRWVIDGVNHGKASPSAACSRGKVTEVMPSSGCRASTALPGAVTSLGRSCWNAGNQQQPGRKGWRCWQDDPGWTGICAVRAAAVAWVGLSAPCRSVEAFQRVLCAWRVLQNPFLLVK